MTAPHPRTRYPTNRILRDQLTNLIDSGVEMWKTHHRFATRFSCRHKLIRFIHIPTERFLHEHMFAGFQRFDTP